MEFRLTLQHPAPVGPIRHILLQRHLQHSRLIPAGDAEHGQGLHSPLVQPTDRQLAGSGNPHFHASGVRQIDVVGLHAVRQSPRGFATGALRIVAEFWLNDTEVTAGQPLEAGVAIAVLETALGLPPAGNTKDGT